MKRLLSIFTVFLLLIGCSNTKNDNTEKAIDNTDFNSDIYREEIYDNIIDSGYVFKKLDNKITLSNNNFIYTFNLNGDNKVNSIFLQEIENDSTSLGIYDLNFDNDIVDDTFANGYSKNTNGCFEDGGGNAIYDYPLCDESVINQRNVLFEEWKRFTINDAKIDYLDEEIGILSRIVEYYYNDISETKENQTYIIYEYFFDNDLRWNMSYKEAKDTIDFSKIDDTHSLAPGNDLSGSTGGLVYYGHTSYEGAKHSEKYTFLFPEGILKSYWVEFDGDYKSDSVDYIYLYNQLRNDMVNRYGEPTSEDYIWTDETYKQNEENWNKAFKYNYLTIETHWTTLEDKDLVIRWNHEKGLYFIVCEKGYIPYL